MRDRFRKPILGTVLVAVTAALLSVTNGAAAEPTPGPPHDLAVLTQDEIEALDIEFAKCDPSGSPTSADAANAAILNDRLQAKLAGHMTAYRVSCARMIVQTVRNRGLAQRAAVIAITTAIVESGLQNYATAVDHDSLGLFQQRPSMGWGTPAQLINPVYATNAFLNKMLQLYPNNAWMTAPIGEVCQAVQVSGFPERYQPQAGDAQIIVSRLWNAQVRRGLDVASWASGRLDVFARGSDDRLKHKWYSGGNWSGWEDLGGTLTSDPTAVSWGDGRLDVFARGTNDALYHKFYTRTKGWSGWEDLGGTLASGPDAASWGPGRLDVFIKGTNGALYHKSYASGDGWSGWESLGGTLASDPSAVSWGDGRIDVFVKGTSDRLFHKSYTRGDGWAAWEGLTGDLASGPDAASWGDGRLDVFIKGTNNALFHKSYTHGTGWSGWEGLSGELTTDPTAVSWGDGRIDVLVKGTNNRLFHKSYTRNNGWAGWENLDAIP